MIPEARLCIPSVSRRGQQRICRPALAVAAITLAVAAAAPVGGPALAQKSGGTGYTWKNVAVSGAGCWVTGITVHPKDPATVYVRTDVGGAYRWDPADARWLPLTDRFSFAESRFFGIESLAVDPRQPRAVYIACGQYTDKEKGAIFKSTDRGATWTRLGLSVPMGSNMDRRWGGERLAVDPADSRVLLFGSRTAGLWRSADGGSVWKRAETVAVADDIYGVGAIAFDPATVGLVYAAVSGGGIAVSRDHGESWTTLAGGPRTGVRRLVAAADHAVWVTHERGVSKYTTAGGWQDFSPGGAPDAFCGIAVNPARPFDVLVSDLSGRFRDTLPGSAGHLYRTRDGGKTWALLPATRRTDVPWYAEQTPDLVNVSALAFDPTGSDRVWAVDWTGIWRTGDINAAPAVFTHLEKGHEEGCINALAAPPAGPELLSGLLDLDGFAHAKKALDRYPAKKLLVASGPWIAHTTSLAFQESDPRHLARTGAQGSGGQGASVAVSDDAGVTWRSLLNYPADAAPQRVALSAMDHRNLVVGSRQRAFDPATRGTRAVAAPWQYTRDGGETWQPCAGLAPSAAIPGSGAYYWQNPLAADGVSGGAFFVYDNADGKVYRSTDGGAHFTWQNTAADQRLPTLRSFQMKARPGVPGEIWMSFDQDSAAFHSPTRSPQEGLYRSTDGGATWARLPGISTAFHFGFGKAAPGSTVPALFLYGRRDGDTSDILYASSDLGKSWTKISAPDNPIGCIPTALEGSRQTYGRVFVGTNGRGIFYGDLRSRPE